MVATPPVHVIWKAASPSGIVQVWYCASDTVDCTYRLVRATSHDAPKYQDGVYLKLIGFYFYIIDIFKLVICLSVWILIANLELTWPPQEKDVLL